MGDARKGWGKMTRRKGNGKTHKFTMESEIRNISGSFPAPYEQYATGKLEDGTEFRIGIALGSRSLYLFAKDRTFETPLESIARAFVSSVIEILAAEKKVKK